MRMMASMIAAASICLASGAALAQSNETTGSIAPNDSGGVRSTAERAMYDNNGPAIHTFVAGGGLSVKRSDGELRSLWNTMDPPARDALAAACQHSENDPGSYSMSTITLCDRVSAMQIAAQDIGKPAVQPRSTGRPVD